MKIRSVILLLLIFGFSFSQTHRFIYELQIHKNNNVENYKMVLDISKSEVKFYDYKFLPIDSIRIKTGERKQAFSEIDQLLLRKINSSENKSFFVDGYDYFAISSNDKMVWKLETETKKIENYTLQKASTNFGGRKWTAWFTTEIPFQEGPYKFRGLSGLIFEIYDAENIFHYSLVKSENLPETYKTNYFLETHYGKKPIAVSLKQFQKVKLDSFNNIVEDLNKFRENGGSIASEKDLQTKDEILKEKKSLQKMRRDYYLPLEKDKAIPYPEN